MSGPLRMFARVFELTATALNEKMLGRLIAARPEALPILVDTGQRALEAYLSFLGECMQRADAGEAAAVGSQTAAVSRPRLFRNNQG